MRPPPRDPTIRTRPDREPIRDRGFALLIVLWTLVLVSLVLTRLLIAARVETQLSGNLRNAAVLQAEADGAVYEAAFHVLDRSPARWVADGGSHRLAIPDGVVDITVDSEAARINPNVAPAPLLGALLRVVGVEPAAADRLADAIVAWRTPAGEAPSMDDAYRAAGRDALPPMQPFESVGELGLVLGMTPSILARIAPYLTVYRPGGPDPAVATPLVRRAIEAAGGPDPRPNSGRLDETVIRVVARASARTGARATRIAVLQLAGQDEGAPVRVLDWTR